MMDLSLSPWDRVQNMLSHMSDNTHWNVSYALSLSPPILHINDRESVQGV